MMRLLTFASFALTLLPLAAPAEPPPTTLARPVPVLQQWTGALEKTELRDLAPRNHVVTNQKDWAALWAAWRGGEPPAVDFAKELILVRTTPGRKGFTELIWRIDEVGDLTFTEKVEPDEKPGFSFVVQKIGRGGVRKVNGSFLPE